MECEVVGSNSLLNPNPNPTAYGYLVYHPPPPLIACSMGALHPNPTLSLPPTLP